jgi:hypothetical protein
MLSDRLREFLAVWGGPDADAEDTAEMLRQPGGAYYLEWLPRELGQAIRQHELTPELMSTMLQMHFEDQAALDRWLRRRWQMWLAEPYPE